MAALGTGCRLATVEIHKHICSRIESCCWSRGHSRPELARDIKVLTAMPNASPARKGCLSFSSTSPGRGGRNPAASIARPYAAGSRCGAGGHFAVDCDDSLRRSRVIECPGAGVAEYSHHARAALAGEASAIAPGATPRPGFVRDVADTDAHSPEIMTRIFDRLHTNPAGTASGSPSATGSCARRRDDRVGRHTVGTRFTITIPAVMALMSALSAERRWVTGRDHDVVDVGVLVRPADLGGDRSP